MSEVGQAVAKKRRPPQGTKRLRWVEVVGCFVLGFCLRSLYDLVVIPDAIIQPFLVSHMETKNYENNHLQKISATPPLKPLHENGLEFVFVIGLEGTGHHLMETIIKGSPDFSTMKSLGLRSHVKQIHTALFDDATNNGLFDMSCKEEKLYVKLDKEWVIKSLPPSNSKNASNSRTNNETNGGALPASFNTVDHFNQVATLLQSLQQIYDQSTTLKPQPLRIPLNSVGLGGTGAGMMSYPSFRGLCYTLRYPILDLLYNVCSEVGVACSHVYIYRHPLDVLQSTTVNRNYNPPGMVYASHLYTSHLKLIQSQLLAYPHRNRGCFGFFEGKESIVQDWQSTVQDMWGWTSNNQTNSFDTFIREKYKKPLSFRESSSNHIVATEVDGLYPPEHLPYLKVFLKAHEQTLETCRDTLFISRQMEKGNG